MTIKLNYPESVTVQSLAIETTETPFAAICDLYLADRNDRRLVRSGWFDRLNPEGGFGPEPFAPLVMGFGEQSGRRFEIDLKGVPESLDVREAILTEHLLLEQYPEKLLNKLRSIPTPDWNAYIWGDQPHSSPEGAVPSSEIIDISRFLNGDTLRWNAPQGKWRIVRIGMTTTGKTNSPAPPDATGLEIDKMKRKALDHHYDSFVGSVIGGMEKKERKSFHRIIADSYETGPQNWTDDLKEVFFERYGYDPLPWLGTITGSVIGSVVESNRFLWDLRRLVAERVASEYVGGLSEMCERHGVELWLENYGWNGFPSEFLLYSKYAHNVGGEFWTNHGQNIENRLAASGCHIYGKQLVYSESYTTLAEPYEYYPEKLKASVDKAYADGVNQHILHVTIHQPDEDKYPGINTWFGIEFNRQNTWFEHSRSWIDYQRRCCYMLQQGLPVTDIAYFIGEESPRMSGWTDPNVPSGYDYDFINSDAIENLLDVRDGRLVLPSGMSYSILVLPPLPTMRPELLEAVMVLVEKGACVAGRPVERSPSLQGYPECDRRVAENAKKLWGTSDYNTSERIEVHYGKGRVCCNIPVGEILKSSGYGQAVFLPGNVVWKERLLGNGGRIYFISNPSSSPSQFDAMFRLSGFVPELWNPVDGSMRRLREFSSEGPYVKVPLRLQAGESCFVVFSRKGKALRNACPNYREMKTYMTVSGHWNASFKNRWTKEDFGIEEFALCDWSASEEERLRYFSGTATFTKTIDIGKRPDSELWLDIEHMKVVASVAVNGKRLEREVWCAPYRIEISKYLRDGENTIAVEITNSWKNRVVGEFVGGYKTPGGLFSMYLPQHNDLLPSGMWGEIKLLTP